MSARQAGGRTAQLKMQGRPPDVLHRGRPCVMSTPINQQVDCVRAGSLSCSVLHVAPLMRDSPVSDTRVQQNALDHRHSLHASCQEVHSLAPEAQGMQCTEAECVPDARLCCYASKLHVLAKPLALAQRRFAQQHRCPAVWHNALCATLVQGTIATHSGCDVQL